MRPLRPVGIGLVLLGSLLSGCGLSVAPPLAVSIDDDEPVAAIAAEVAQCPTVDASLLDPELADYRPVGRLTGRITSVGSDSMNNLMLLWVEGFRAYYPQVEFEVDGKGSSTAMPALVAGAANFGPMSRDPKRGEIDDFKARFGYPPTALATCIDMLAVYVNKDNPVARLTLPQVDAIFSKTRKLGFPREINTWGELKLPPAWSNRAIGLYGRNAASGTYGYFKDHALGGGDFRDSVKEQPGSSSVVQAVGSDPGAIGYSGIGYRTADVRPVPLSRAENQPAIAAEPKFAYSGEYPLARYLWLTVNYSPGSELPPLEREFVTYVLSRQGQEKAIVDGYLPLPAQQARQMLALVGVTIGS